ncbi:hypothetical protein [Novosphingobium sp. TH158]|uniref:hypothetical protein n=1 Tax=Novosphingobium sp. TH158 TaxID=2067455 RepID=UPI000C7DD2AF|nr:hypothetical protein [Novosphingobium sp. TH158]PLK26887.1 hypothetical protein C0V78_08285 [Novosphingobium sp. TH158]
MNRILPLAAALLVTAIPASAQQAPLPRLNLAQETTLRCSAAFGLVAFDQKRGAPGASEFPPLAERGREFFVRTTARLMDETGASREAVQALLKARVEELQKAPAGAAHAASSLKAVVRACLPLLDSEVPEKR